MTTGTPAAFRAAPQQLQVLSDSTRPWVQITAVTSQRLPIGRFTANLAAVSAAHEILRTRLVVLAGQSSAAQVIGASGPVVTVAPELADDAVGRAELGRLCTQERSRCDPSADPVRVLIANFGTTTAVVLTASGAVLDRPSLRMLLTWLVAPAEGSAPPADIVQYADYAAWHEHVLADEERAHRRGFWNDAAAAPALTAPGSRTGTGTAGGPEHRTPPARLADRPELAAAEVLSAWAVILHRFGGPADGRLSLETSGRRYPALGAALGVFARDVPLQAGFDDDTPFHSLRNDVAGAMADAVEHGDDLAPAWRANRLPAAGFQEVESLAPMLNSAVSSCREECSAPAQPVLRLANDDDGSWLEIGFDPELMQPADADALLHRVVGALGFVGSDPQAPTGVIDLCQPGEAATLALIGPQPQAAHGTLYERFAAQARITPEAPAVRAGAGTFSYRQLEAAANRFAEELELQGVRPGDFVVLRMHRSAELLVAVLATAAAGAVFVPVDVRQPPARLEAILADVGARIIVSDQRSTVPDGLPATVLGCTIPVDLSPADRRESVARPESPRPDDLAYLLYTSGSTGTPNGVPVTHASLMNYLAWAVDAYDLASGSGALVHSPIGFDLTLTGLLAPLLAGQQVILVPEGPGLGELVHLLSTAADLTLLKLTPAQLAAVTAAMAPATLTGRVRTIVVGGEALDATHISGLRDAGIRIVNEYGPTEAVVGCCAHTVGPGTPVQGAVPIGRPIAGTTLHVLDPAMRPVPPGVTGELFIGGAGVGIGYWNRPIVTQKRFVPNPFDSGTRLYRTGDLVVVNEDDGLVFLRRADDQFKVRGVRLEPAEIETALLRHPRIAAAAAGPGPAPDDETRYTGASLIAGFVTRDGAEAPRSEELAEHCRLTLPEYLVPDTFVELSSLPLTVNGKVDRPALAAIVRQRHPALSFTAPRTPTERVLAEAIGGVLGLDRVGIDDSYFVLGGDSIRSVMVASRAQSAGVALTVADLHQHPTVRELSSVLPVNGGPSAASPAIDPFELISAADRDLMPVDVEDAFPLTLLQEGMIFHRDFAAKSAVYHAIASVRIRGPLDIGLLRQVIGDLVGRHPMLRTSFDQANFSQPLQLVHRTFSDPMVTEDLRTLDPAEQQARIRGWVDDERARGFELDEFPLIRFMVQPLDDETFQFTYGFHHEIVDGWSEALMMTELFGHYFSLAFGEPFTPEPPRTSMRDAVALELAALQDPEKFAFWDDYLHDPAVMRLPRPDGPKADDGSREIVRIAVPISGQISDAAKALARTEGVPLKAVLLASHLAVMNHYHGQQDTLTYTVTNGRPENLDGSTAIGLFVNSLALRVRLSGGTWRDLIAATLESERASMPHRRLPMAELKRHQGNEPLAETLFFFTDYHVFHELDRWQSRGVEHEASELYGESTFPFCAIFRLNTATGALEVRLEYDRLQFSSELMTGLADCYRRTLEQIVTAPENLYHISNLMSDHELQQVQELTARQSPAPASDGLLHELVLEQCRRTPDAIAIRWGEACLTYASLDLRSAQLAGELAHRGAAPGRSVAILAGRGPDTIIGVLAALRTGAAYLPLNPDDPDERLAGILAEAAPAVLLAGPDQSTRPISGTVRVMRLGERTQRPRFSSPAISPLSVAALIYTSGSTGHPKGVEVTHAGLVHSTRARTIVYGEAPERFALLSSLAFDSSAAGIFWTLSSGGTLILPPEGTQREPAELARLMQSEQVTHTLGVPSLLLALLDQAEPERVGTLRSIITAGEAAGGDLARRCREVAPGAALHNEYGPTENSVWSTVLTAAERAPGPGLPIGTPVPGVRVHVLNDHGMPVPMGVTGNLHVSGAGLAQGYRRRPAVTADVFRPDPFASHYGRRLYNTGDLVRHLRDGNLGFAGRADGQIKIRGHRVELGEIEASLFAHPGVAGAVVVVRPDPLGAPSLVAYVTAADGVKLDADDVQRHLRTRLPMSMIPRACVVLDALPQARSGKIDRSALPEPVTDGAGIVRIAPRDDVEQAIADIWSLTLGGGEPGVLDDFFRCGGESLRAMKVITGVNKAFGTELSVRSLFDNPTIDAFARVVRDAGGRP